ncbi:LOW QUALITY PROTEIN: noroxomaritidine synthase 2-like [Spinacia oleracea]|uniref:LOW QUALITY PROTEIN: noroxomaritidine synthase 2-like n=1 Tax=Spinacia oleracea TaxID=3562 RepID=A0ABM3QL82_SPIOL|nr:LOW QUALITY PROTEIN: noroxomaritidine synthase 2-like [Spinacia oleracea]
MAYMIIITLIISFVFFCCFFRNKNGLPTNWPLVGMLPALLINTHRINDFIIELMQNSDLNFHLKGPWFTNMNFLFTVDPTNINHVLSKKFENYVKGAKLNEILEPLGEGMFNTDSSLWRYHRNVAQSFFNHPKFHHFLVDVTWKKVKVYFHAALCEALRLYPPIASNLKTPTEPDILPSGHRVNPNIQIVFHAYAMGRMKSIWGDDCNEFKPERWISEQGMIKHEPSYKFSVFSSGPRICMGKQMVFTQMKIIAAIIIQNYHII